MSQPPARRPLEAHELVARIEGYAIIALDESGTIESWNAGAERLKGYAADEAVGRNFSMFYTPEDRISGLPLQLLERARAEGSVTHTGWRVRQDGTRFWGDVLITALVDDDGVDAGFVKVTRDLTEEHALREELEASEARFRVLVDQVRDYAIIALDASGTIQSWNAGAERLKGYGRTQALGRHFSIFYTEEDRAAGLPLRLLAEAREHGSVEHTGWRVRSNGTRFWGDVVITALHDDDGRLRGYAKVTRDLTARKRLEQSRETFFDTFAHDVGEPVAAVDRIADELESATPDEQAALVRRLRAHAARLSAMTADLQQLSHLGVDRQAARRTQDVAVADVVAAALETLSDRLSGPVSDRLDADRVQLVVPDLQVRADPVAVQRILGHLLTNAAQFSPAGSTIVVAASEVEGRVRIAVSDRGRGIAPDDLGTIFDQFERGRLATDDEHGTGLGLTSARLLAEREDGAVFIVSEVGGGTTVTVELPAP